RKHDVAVTEPLDILAYRALFRFHRYVTIAEKILGRLFRQLHLEFADVIGIVIIQTSKEPRRPTAIGLHQPQPQFREAVEDSAGTKAYRRHHWTKHVQKLVLHHQVLHEPQAEISKTVRPRSVENNRHFQPFALRPHGIVSRMVPGSFVDDAGAKKDCLETEL